MMMSMADFLDVVINVTTENGRMAIGARNGETQLLVTDEPVESKK